jgi:hypothetical protein
MAIDESYEVGAVLDLLRGRLGSYRGGGRNHLDEDFSAELTLAAAGGDAGILLTFTAIADAGQTTAQGTVLHTEHSLIAAAVGGGVVLAQLGSNGGSLLVHELRRAHTEDGAGMLVFGYGQPDVDSFAEELTLSIGAPGELGYAFAWGHPGDAFGPRSSAKLLKLH